MPDRAGNVLERGEVSEVVVYEHDDEGRLLRRTEDDRDAIVYRYAGGRVREIEDEDDHREYRHDAAGRLSGPSVAFVDEDTGSVTSSVGTYEHENEPCVGQASARPELNLSGELYGIGRPVSAALDCGYWLRQSL